MHLYAGQETGALRQTVNQQSYTPLHMIPFKVACQRFGFLCQKVITVGIDFFFFFLHKKGQTSSSEHVYILNEFKILKL